MAELDQEERSAPSKLPLFPASGQPGSLYAPPTPAVIAQRQAAAQSLPTFAPAASGMETQAASYPPPRINVSAPGERAAGPITTAASAISPAAGNEGRGRGLVNPATQSGYGDNFGPGVSYLAPGANPPAAAAPVATTTGGGMTGFGNDLGAIRAELERYRATDRPLEGQFQQQKTNAIAANAAYADAYNRNALAKRDAEVAAFRAENAADVVLRDTSSPLAAQQQRNAIAANAAVKGAIAKGAEADLIKAQAGLGGNRNYIDEYGKLQNAQSLTDTAQSRLIDASARKQEAGARVTEAGARAELERAQATTHRISNEQHQKILTLVDAMGKAKTPEETAKLEKQIIALTGKNPKEYGIQVARGEDRGTGPTGMPLGRDPDRVYLYSLNNPNDVRELTGGKGGQGNGLTPDGDAIKLLRENPNDPKMLDYFKRTYGRPPTPEELGKK